MPIELNVFTDTEDQEIQTDDLFDLFKNLEVVEVPVEVDVKDHISIDAPKR